jgi:hypothetical protein
MNSMVSQAAVAPAQSVLAWVTAALKDPRPLSPVVVTAIVVAADEECGVRGSRETPPTRRIAVAKERMS